jgi:vacuolar-type H+-ATPase subunit E/Vma4
VGYRELLEALEDEVERQIRQIEVETDQACQRLVAETHRERAARREDALAREGQRLDEDARRAAGRARFEQARTLLGEQRGLLADLCQEAERRPPALDEAALLARLVDELVPELGDGPVELRVNLGQEAAFARDLARRHPELGSRATVTGADSLGGGVVAAFDGGRQILDNSLPSRLEKAWQLLEGEIAADLFGDTDGSRV